MRFLVRGNISNISLYPKIKNIGIMKLMKKKKGKEQVKHMVFENLEVWDPV